MVSETTEPGVESQFGSEDNLDAPVEPVEKKTQPLQSFQTYETSSLIIQWDSITFFSPSVKPETLRYINMVPDLAKQIHTVTC